MKRIREKTGYLVETFSTLSKRYGPVVGLKIGNDRIVILNDLESMKAMLMNEDCEGRPNGPIFKIRTWGLRRGIYLKQNYRYKINFTDIEKYFNNILLCRFTSCR